MITAADIRSTFLFNSLTDEQVEDLIAHGEEVVFGVGDVLFEEGQPADFLWVFIEGRVQLFRRVEHEETTLFAMERPGQWAGGFRAWHNEASYLATARGAEPGRMFKLPAPALSALAHQWFPFGVHLIEGIFQTVRRLEGLNREQEKFVALGRISSALTHELNNPAAAATQAVESLDYNCHHMFESLTKLATHELKAAEFIDLEAMRRDLEEVPPSNHDPLAHADREDQLAGWLETEGVEAAWQFASTLAAAGADIDWCQRIREVVGSERLEAGLEWVTSAVAVNTLLREMRESTSRIAGLVSSGRTYTQLDRAARQTLGVVDGIESTLTMLRHRIGDHVRISRAYQDELPQIDGYPGALNQVWTNLIGNAIDAMDDRGDLTISVQSDGDTVVVEITDSGKGMTAEEQARAFEPFFTTKDVGKGTGLGLDISRQIVHDRHGGQISIVRSAPGETVIRVRLPVTQD
ncbi:MAG TPA: ATP-binding protein [Acidimicrobiales bacterium]|nr:ATP-binding protein [Acidimicrobiales bacterium]